MADMEGTIKYGDMEVDVVDIHDWDFEEVAAAEDAFNVDLDDARTSKRLQMAIFISIRRVDKTTPVGALADMVRRMKFASAVQDKAKPEGEELPLGEPANGEVDLEDVADPATIGSRRMATGST